MIQLMRFCRPLAAAESRQLNCTLCKKFNLLPMRSISLTAPNQLPQNYPSPYGNDSWKLKIRRKLGLLALPRQEIRESSAHLYVECTDKLDTVLFFKEFELEDTFFSWFILTELHLWMLLCRSTKEGPEGDCLRKELCNRLWEDAGSRLKKLAPGMGLTARRETLVDMGDQFRAFLVSMDEGLLTDDKTMASALWRNVYGRNCSSPLLLERMIQYIRTEMDHLMSLDKEIILRQGTIQEPFYWGHFEPFHVS